MDIDTANISTSVPLDTARRVEAFVIARNGATANVVAELLEAGLHKKLSDAPESFVDRFKKASLGLAMPETERET